MSQRRCLSRLASTLLSLLVLTRALFAPSPVAANPCAAAEPIVANETSLRQRDGADVTDLFELTLPAPGVLLVHAAAAAGEVTDPRIALFDAGCGTAGFDLVRQTPTGLLVRVRMPGAYRVAVSPRDPALPLYAYKLVTLFTPEPIEVHQQISLDDSPASCAVESLPSWTIEPLAESRFVQLHHQGVATEDVDPIDDDLVSGGSVTPGVIIVEADAPIEAALYDGTECGPAERLTEGTLGAIVAPLPAGDSRLRLRSPAGATYTAGVKFLALCAAAMTDDHADVPLCATPLGAGAPGTIDTVEDEDYFTFVVERTATVALATRAERPVRVTLFDASGQRLESRLACRRGCGHRIVRRLGPGRYAVAVGGDGVAGADYALRVDRLGAP